MNLTTFSDKEAMEMMAKIEEAASNGDVEEAERLLLILEESRAQQRIAMKNLEMQEREARERILSQTRGQRQSQFRVDSMVLERKSLAHALERQSITEKKIIGAERTLTQAEKDKALRDEQRRLDQEAKDAEEEEERDRIRKQEEEKRLERERLAEEKRMVMLMERAEERLKREEAERKKKEREARRLQTEKKENYRRSLIIRQEELQAAAAKGGHSEANKAELLAKPRHSSRSSRRSVTLSKGHSINAEAVSLITKVRDDVKSVGSLFSWISQNPTSDRIPSVKTKLLTVITAVVQNSKIAAEKLRWENEEFSPGVLGAIRDVVQAVKLFTQAVDGNYDTNAKKIAIPKASDNLSLQASNLIFADSTVQEKKQTATLLAGISTGASVAPTATAQAPSRTINSPVVATNQRALKTSTPEPAKPVRSATPPQTGPKDGITRANTEQSLSRSSHAAIPASWGKKDSSPSTTPPSAPPANTGIKRGGPPPPPPPMGAKKKEEAGPPLQISLPPPPPTGSSTPAHDSEEEDGPLPDDYATPERPTEMAKVFDLSNPAHIAVLAYIEQLEDDYETLNRKYEKLRRQAQSGVGGSVLGQDLKTIEKSLAEMQAKLFDPNIDPAEAELLNIEYEKITNQMEKMPEYQQKLKKEKEKWSRDNYELNVAAFERVVQSLQAMPAKRREELLKKEVCLTLLTMNVELIKKKYKGDWKTMTPHNLTLDQARAVFCILPEFRPDQAEQLQFVESLKQKIEDLQNKKPIDKPIKGKAIKFKKPTATSNGGGGGGFFEELLQKRKKR